MAQGWPGTCRGTRRPGTGSAASCTHNQNNKPRRGFQQAHGTHPEVLTHRDEAGEGQGGGQTAPQPTRGASEAAPALPQHEAATSARALAADALSPVTVLLRSPPARAGLRGPGWPGGGLAGTPESLTTMSFLWLRLGTHDLQLAWERRARPRSSLGRRTRNLWVDFTSQEPQVRPRAAGTQSPGELCKCILPPTVT